MLSFRGWHRRSVGGVCINNHFISTNVFCIRHCPARQIHLLHVFLFSFIECSHHVTLQGILLWWCGEVAYRLCSKKKKSKKKKKKQKKKKNAHRTQLKTKGQTNPYCQLVSYYAYDSFFLALPQDLSPPPKKKAKSKKKKKKKIRKEKRNGFPNA